MTSLNKFNFQTIFLFILMNIIYCEINFGKDINDTCSVNLQCLSGCCQKDKCEDTKKCKNFRNTVYVAVAIVGAALAIIFSIYLLISLYRIRKIFNEKAQQKRGTDSRQVIINNKLTIIRLHKPVRNLVAALLGLKNEGCDAGAFLLSAISISPCSLYNKYTNTTT